MVVTQNQRTTAGARGVPSSHALWARSIFSTARMFNASAIRHNIIVVISGYRVLLLQYCDLAALEKSRAGRAAGRFCVTFCVLCYHIRPAMANSGWSFWRLLDSILTCVVCCERELCRDDEAVAAPGGGVRLNGGRLLLSIHQATALKGALRSFRGISSYHNSHWFHSSQ